MPLARLCRVSALLATTFLPVLPSADALDELPGQGGAQPDAQANFPDITAEALDRTVVTLPKQFEGRQNLVFFFWTRSQESQIDSWAATAQALQHKSSDFRVYRMPVSPRENALYRWWDNNSLRAAETDPELLHWTVPLYTDKSQLRRSLGLEDDDRAIDVVLLDRAGRLLWKSRGPSTEAGRAGLLAAAQKK